MVHFGRCTALVVLLLCLPATPARAEIIVAPAGSNSTAGATKSAPSKAAENRDRARSYQTEAAPTPGTTVIVVPDGDEGVLAPRGNTNMQDNRNKAREYQRGNTGVTAPQILVVPERHEAGVAETPRERVEENRSKARAYMKGESPFGATGDKLPVVSCRDVENSSGRIGDDSQSGSVITIMRDGRPYKVRCK